MPNLFTKLVGAGAILLGAIATYPASARYLRDTSIYPNGDIDISIRGNAAIAPGALYASVGGNEFITIGQRDNALAVCSFTAAAALQSAFGSNGCYRETLGATESAYQLLVGKSGYWVFIADFSNTKRFSLLRLTAAGQPDINYGASGRRSFDLACDASDVAMGCPEILGGGAQQSLNFKAYIAETGDYSLWLLASRKTSSGADEGVVLHIEQGRNITTRANLFDALPPNWIPGMQQSVTIPVGIVAHADGVLVEHRTNNGYALIRVGGNGAIDSSFAVGQPNGIIVAGDGALPENFFQMPVVASDNTFCWGISSGQRTRYDGYGTTLGTFSLPGTFSNTRMVTAPGSFANASAALWVWDGNRLGRWQNGQWDATVFGGNGPLQPASGQTVFALTNDERSAAMATAFFSSSAPAQLSIVATQLVPQTLLAPLVLQADAVLTATAAAQSIDANTILRYATQEDGTIVWQRIAFDPHSAIQSIATGVLTALPSGSLGNMQVSNASGSDARWVIRSLFPVENSKPNEFYADLTGSNLSTRRINMDAIRAEMPAFIPTAPFSNPFVWNVDLAADGSAQALIAYAYSATPPYHYRLALLRWNQDSVVANEYQPQIDWRFDAGSFPFVQRDAQGKLLLIDSSARRIRRISAQGVLDQAFAQAGTLDLSVIGFVPSDFSGSALSVISQADGGIWLGVASRIAHLDASGQLLAQATLAPRAPTSYTPDNRMPLVGMIADTDSLLMVSAAPQTAASQLRTYRLLRYTPSSELDVPFGLRGAETLALSPSSSSQTVLPLANHGLAVLAGNAISLFRLDSTQPGIDGTTVPVVEFYNSTLNHYFMTADTEEIAGIEAGASGPGWSRTGQSFRAYANLIQAPGDALDICRFYGSAVPRASSPNGRTGPNSHFYTFAGQECDNVYNNDKAWQYEGSRLTLIPLLADKSCASGQQPIFRAYNNGYEVKGGVWAKNDSNHRYATSQIIISGMVAQGWTGEGVVFCAPN